MVISHPIAVIGTNAWGSKTYGKLVRGSYVDEATIRESIELAKDP